MTAVAQPTATAHLKRQGDVVALPQDTPQIRAVPERPRFDLGLDLHRYTSSEVSTLGTALDEGHKPPAPGSNEDWLQACQVISAELEQRLLVGAGATRTVAEGVRLIERVLAAYKLRDAQFNLLLNLLKLTSTKAITPGVQALVFEAVVGSSGLVAAPRALSVLAKEGMITRGVASELTAQIDTIKKAQAALRDVSKPVSRSTK